MKLALLLAFWGSIGAAHLLSLFCFSRVFVRKDLDEVTTYRWVLLGLSCVVVVLVLTVCGMTFDRGATLGIR